MSLRKTQTPPRTLPSPEEIYTERYPQIREGTHTPLSEFVMRYHNKNKRFLNAFTTQKNLVISTEVSEYQPHRHLNGLLGQIDIITTELPRNIEELYYTKQLEGKLRKPQAHKTLLKGLLQATQDQPRPIYHLGAIIPELSVSTEHKNLIKNRQPQRAYQQLQRIQQEHPDKIILAFADYVIGPKTK